MYASKKANKRGASPFAAQEPVMPIAIVGISGRFPGDAENPQKLWDMISEGRSALCDIPEDRFNVDAYYHPHHERQGTINVRKAHFMKRDVSAFDAPFFTMPLAEAKAMDPQQRMALECTYEALENAGIKMEDVSGSDTSCFVGCFTRDYSDMMACDPEDLPLYHGTGTGSAIMSNRISWFFNMKGSSISLDTACSSSMAALHLGCQSLRTGETTMSVVGGTNLMLMPDIMGAMTRLHFLSPDGKCQSFDHKANGYSRGEGAAFVVLKPLELAIQNGDVIRGVIRNSAINQDGLTPGITLPSSEAQEALIRRIYKEAGLDLADTAYVEAHGTGTPAGDPVEAGALARTFGEARVHGSPLYIGSIKSNVGHLEGGSGMVQIVKAVMMLEKGEIPPSIWYEKPNPRIPMDEWNLKVPTELIPWPTEGLRRVSINSFGYGGTNAHCVIDDAYHYLKARKLQGNHNVQNIDSPTPLSTPDSGVDVSHDQPEQALWESLKTYITNPIAADIGTSPKLLLWTSNEQSGIERNANVYTEYLSEKVKAELAKKEDRILLGKFAKTLGTRRSILPWRSFAIADSCEDAIIQMQSPPVKPLRSSNSKTAPKLAFVFTGQGAQWFAMGRELYAHAVFRESLEDAGRYLVDIGSSWSLITEMFRSEEWSKLDSAELSQPICTALQVALVDLLKTWGVSPTAVIGHSSGEIAAAYAKGAITREYAWKIAYHRGHLSRCIPAFAPTLEGSMLATGIGAAVAETYIAQLTNGNATVACINSPASTTISGDSVAINELEVMIKKDGHFARKLKVDVAYHSPHMQVIAEKYRQALGEIRTLPEDGQAVQMFSSLTGKRVKDNSSFNAEYWVANMVNPVNFSGALIDLLKHNDGNSKRRSKKAYVEHIIEIGPHAALQGPIKQVFGDESVSSLTKDITYQSVLQRGKNACLTALTIAGRLFQYGYPLKVHAILGSNDNSSKDGFLVDMPPFGWNHSLKYWSEPHAGLSHRFRKHIRKDLFGGETRDGISEEPRYRNILRLAEVPWTQYHKVQGSILYPAAGMMITAIEAMCQRADPSRPVEGYELRDVIIGKAIVIPQDDTGVETMLTLKPFRDGSKALSAAWEEFKLYSRKDEWELNCSGLIKIEYKATSNPVFANEQALTAQSYAREHAQARVECYRTQHPRYFYDQLNSIGLYYGGVFQSLTEIRKGEYQSACKIQIPDTKSIMPHEYEFSHVIHPATLDSIIQMALPASSHADEELSSPMVPVGIGRLYVSADVPSAAGVVLSGYASSKITGFEEGESKVVVSDETWNKPLVIFEGVKGKKLSAAPGSDVALRKIGTYFHWQEDLTLLKKDEVRKLCNQALGQLGQVGREVLVELELACMVVINRVLKECSIEESEKYDWNFKLFYDYMVHYHKLAQAGEIAYQKVTPNIDWLNLGQKAEDELLARVSKASTDGRALVEHGKYLPQILRGEIPPLQIMMADNFLHDFYKDGLGTAQHYAQMSWYVDQMAHKNPNMKILEIGAGTAGATLPVLTKLGGANGTAPRFSSYMFTDISVGYFEKARTKLAPWLSFLNFATLNIEDEPTDQGFEEGAYDLIVASNVLHATRSIHKTLSNARKLLKPEGKLVLTEVTQYQKMRFHMIVGSLEGWWYGEEDGRLLGPTLEVEQWDQALTKAGFDGVEVDFQDFPDRLDTGLSVIVSSASAPTIPVNPQDVIIVLTSQSEPDVIDAAEKVRSRLVSAGSHASVLQLQDTTALDLENKSILCLVDANENSGFLPEVSESEWDALKHLILSSRDITYVTRGATMNSANPSANLMTGMARSIRSENYGLCLATLDAQHGVALNQDQTISALLKIFSVSSNSKDAEKPDWEYAIRNGMPMIQRVLLEKGVNDLAASWHTAPKPEQATFKQQGRPLTLGVGTPGRLDTLRFEDDKSALEPLGPDDVEITVKAAGLNFKDVMVAMGQLSQPALGVDCAGIVNRVGSNVRNIELGTAVMTWKLRTFGNVARVPASMVQRVPADMDLATAASLPVIYSTAHYSLSTVARLRKGETLLVHGAAGGVGQAAIVLAQHIGATVIATVSSEAKKELLMNTYGIPESHIVNSREETAFAQAVMRLTNNRGADVVLNSLAGEALRASWRAIARFGRFIELGQRDIVGNKGLDMEPFLRNVSFHSVNMLDLQDWDIAAAAQAFAEVADLLHKGIAKPVFPTTVMPFSRVEEAFRMMQTGKHIGKIVLEANNDDIVSVMPAVAAPVRFQADATYIIAGGGGGLGRAIAEWMVKLGARNILLLSRSGTKKATVRDVIARLAKEGAKVDAWPCNVGEAKQVTDMITRLQVESWPSVRGVIQGAMDLKDSIYQNMTREQFHGSIVPKVHGSWNLHHYLPKDMDFYVLLSSSVGIAGSRGQGNYSAGNSYQDALAHYRRSQGMAACSIDVGMILGVGFLAEDTTEAHVHDNVKSWNFLGIREREFLGILEAAIRGESLPGIEVPPQLITGLGTGGMMAQGSEKYPWWFNDAKFSHLVHVDTHQISQDSGDEANPISMQLSQATSLDDAGEIVTEALVKKLAKSLMVSAEDIEATKPVSSYGVDSLLAVELRTWIHSEIKAEISVFDLLSNVPITTLAAKLAAGSKALPKEILSEA